MPYTVTQTDLPGVLILEPRLFGDDRGYFYESFNARDFAEATGLTVDFVQDNHSKSAKGVLRGLHYQLRQTQGKLVRVIAGAVFDVAVDMRRSSPHFGKWTGVMLSAENRRQLWVPEGFAHGFLVTEGPAEFLYKTTDYWSAPDERSLAWDDAHVAIDWPLDGAPTLAGKDTAAAHWDDAEYFA